MQSKRSRTEVELYISSLVKRGYVILDKFITTTNRLEVTLKNKDHTIKIIHQPQGWFRTESL